MRTARDVLSPELPAVEQDTQVDDAALLCRRDGLGGVVIADGDLLIGRVALVDLDRAAGHGLGHAPVKAVMTSGVTAVPADTPLERVAVTLSQEDIGWAPVVTRRADGRRRDAERRARQRSAPRRRRRGRPRPRTQAPVVANLAGRLGELGLDDVLRHIQAVAAGVRGVYLVGGAVRDLLLGEPGMDIDIAVEGDGIAFAEELAGRLKGHVRPHEKFGTASSWCRDDGGERLRIDVASTRSESYEYPAALPKVEHAGIRSDLARRDFTINAMAVSLKPETFGNLLDYFGGLADLEARRIVVLHNLSFIEDPTRILRAIRYETRYGLRMDEHTLNLARAACAMDLVGDLSSARLRDELVALLDEEKIDFALRRMDELGLSPSIHGAAALGHDGAQARASRRRACGASTASKRRCRAGACASSGCCATSSPRRSPPGPSACASAVTTRPCWSAASSSLGGSSSACARGPSEAELYDFARGEPLESLLAAMVLDETGVADGRARSLSRRDAARAPRDRRRGPARAGLRRLAAHGRGAAQRASPQAERRRRGRDDELAAAARMR